MRSIMFVVLVGYMVKCDDASYYVIEIPEEPKESKQFKVYWNVPTMQCRSKKIPFTDLFDSFGIIQNSGDSFRGESISILYDPGLFPALLKNETSGKFKFRNGGVPQEGDLEKHLAAFKVVMEQSVPDPHFSGVGIIDFESWRPVFRQNFGVLIPYKDISYQIERKLHWFWPEKSIQARARQRFEESGRQFMAKTLAIARQMRPRARWGYYAFPYCFNMASNNMAEGCADGVQRENDNIQWLWDESTALYPSVYISRGLSSSQQVALVRGRVKEAARVGGKYKPILPYFWFRYRDGGFLPQEELDAILGTLYKSTASGFIIWGSSNDVNTVDKCQKLLKYTEEILGPSIAKYTKTNSNNIGTTRNPILSTGITTWRPILKDHLVDNKIGSTEHSINPDYHWEPPENYTQDIVHYVENEMKTRNITKNYVYDKPQLISVQKNTLLELLYNMLSYEKEVNKETSFSNDKEDEEEKQKTNLATAATVKLENYSLNNTGEVNNFTTNNPVEFRLKNQQKGIHNEDKNLEQNTNLTTIAPPLTTRGYQYIINSTVITTEEPITESQTDIDNSYTEKESSMEYFNFDYRLKTESTTELPSTFEEKIDSFEVDIIQNISDSNFAYDNVYDFFGNDTSQLGNLSTTESTDTSSKPITTTDTSIRLENVETQMKNDKKGYHFDNISTLSENVINYTTDNIVWESTKPSTEVDRINQISSEITTEPFGVTNSNDEMNTYLPSDITAHNISDSLEENVIYKNEKKGSHVETDLSNTSSERSTTSLDLITLENEDVTDGEFAEETTANAVRQVIVLY